MILATCNKAKRLLLVSYIGQVRTEDVQESLADVEDLVVELGPGFRVVADLTHLEAMHLRSPDVLGELMEILDQGGVHMVARVIPDPQEGLTRSASS